MDYFSVLLTNRPTNIKPERILQIKLPSQRKVLSDQKTSPTSSPHRLKAFKTQHLGLAKRLFYLPHLSLTLTQEVNLINRQFRRPSHRQGLSRLTESGRLKELKAYSPYPTETDDSSMLLRPLSPMESLSSTKHSPVVSLHAKLPAKSYRQVFPVRHRVTKSLVQARYIGLH